MKTTVINSTRGRKPLNIKFPQGAFTVEQLFALNDKSKGGVVKCELTARNHIKRALAADVLVKLPEKLKTGTVGAPAFKFILKARHLNNLAKRSKRTVVGVKVVDQPVPAPVAEAALVTA